MDPGQPTIYTVVRVDDTNPAAGSRALRLRRLRVPCERCRKVCWFDPQGFNPLLGSNISVLCRQCTRDKTREAKTHG